MFHGLYLNQDIFLNMNKNQKYIIAGVLVVLFVAAAIFIRSKIINNSNNIIIDKNPATPNIVNTTTDTNKATATTPVTKPAATVAVPKKVEIKKPVVSKSAPQSYVDAAAKYKKSGYYIQFYPCQATPGSLIVKQGSKIMLDNRDGKAHSIGIKNDKYLIASYNYAIATLNTIGTNYVTCDGGGSASVTVVP